MVALMEETAEVLRLNNNAAREEERCSGPGEPPEGRRWWEVEGRWETPLEDVSFVWWRDGIETLDEGTGKWEEGMNGCLQS